MQQTLGKHNNHWLRPIGRLHDLLPYNVSVIKLTQIGLKNLGPCMAIMLKIKLIF